jgi:hypothetical protein
MKLKKLRVLSFLQSKTVTNWNVKEEITERDDAVKFCQLVENILWKSDNPYKVEMAWEGYILWEWEILRKVREVTTSS